jgi:signal transduction histidine kinase
MNSNKKMTKQNGQVQVPSTKKAIEEKVFVAEKIVSVLRLIVLTHGTLVYLFLIDKSQTVIWLSYFILILSWIYSLYVYFFEPYRRYPVMLSSYFTSITDAIFITIWIYATGAVKSPFYVILYGAVTSIAFRYSYCETMIAAVIYSISYLAMLVYVDQIIGYYTEISVRVAYVFLIALVGALFAREALHQTKAKLELKELTQKLEIEVNERKQAEEALRKAHEELEKRVEERTKELSKSNELLKQEITERKLTEEELKKSREQLRNLSAHLQFAREDERTKIAREVHDELGQKLTALKMDLSSVSNKLPKDKKLLIEKTKSMSKLIDTTIETVQRITTELRPGLLDDLGLIAAIEWQAEEFQSRTGIECEITIDTGNIFLDRDRSTAIFRIFQEALTNVSRHANATRVEVSLKEEENRLELKVKDNGKGIEENQIFDSKSFGLIGIRERVYLLGGEVNISGIKNQGTTIMVNIPLEVKFL